MISGPWSTKLGCSVILRPGSHHWGVTEWVMKSGNVLKLRSDTLSELLVMNHCRFAKNATKVAKIRTLLSLDAVKKACSEEERASIEAKLVILEEKKGKNKKSTNEAAAVEENNEEEAQQSKQ